MCTTVGYWFHSGQMAGNNADAEYIKVMAPNG